ncbi:hypothetical protein RMSM_03696, partial [Rhodopirellula maiorica SM1]
MREVVQLFYLPNGEVRDGGSRIWVGLAVLELDRASSVSPA